MVALRFDCAPLRRAEQKKPTRSPTAASKPVAPYPGLSRRPFARIPAGAEAPPRRCRGPLQNRPPRPAKPEYEHRVPRGFRGPGRAASGWGMDQLPHRALDEDTLRTPPTAAELDHSPTVVALADSNGGRARPIYDACLRQAAAETLEPRPGDANSLVPAESAVHEIGAFGASRISPRRRRSRRPARTSATMRFGSPSGASCGRTPSRPWRTRSCDCGRV